MEKNDAGFFYLDATCSPMIGNNDFRAPIARLSGATLPRRTGT
ncbi:hypothetical protein [Brenneria corticis]|nr:hypothetical protein [Brenneria sp. CFCC 11842]